MFVKKDFEGIKLSNISNYSLDYMINSRIREMLNDVLWSSIASDFLISPKVRLSIF